MWCVDRGKVGPSDLPELVLAMSSTLMQLFPAVGKDALYLVDDGGFAPRWDQTWPNSRSGHPRTLRRLQQRSEVGCVKVQNGVHLLRR